jgi:two-component system chemotaxis response regulator CheY
MAKILIVEEDKVTRNVIKNRLRELGHDIAGELDDAKNIIEYCKKLNPDLITLDLILKNSNTLNYLKEIKKVFPNIKIIIISAINSKKVIFDALNFGADYFIIKPIDIEKLNKAIIKVSNNSKKVNKIRSLYKKSNSYDINDIIEVKNLNGVFRIHIKRKINGIVIEELNKIINVFLIIKPLKIIFTYFDENEKKEVLQKSLNDIIIKIKNSGGEVDIEH